jgi:hypothetical protein
MPCYTKTLKNQSLQSRQKEIEAALKRLESYLQTGTVTAQIGPQGAIVFKGWGDRDGVTDVCAYRSLSLSNSWALKQAVARAEVMSGKKVNAQAIASGLHSHDGGHTWSAH